MTIAGLKHYLSDPRNLFDYASSRGLLNRMSDEKHIRIAFRLAFGYNLDLDAPKTFNEKLQWLKLYNRDPMYTRLVDKYAVREYISEKLGEEYLIPLVGGPWDSADEIDFDSLPDKFVLKTTHDSGGVLICRDKSQLDIENAKEKLRKRLDRDFFYSYREWPYKNVKHRIVAEKYMEDDSGELRDFKLMCFGGKVKLYQIHQDRFTDHTQAYYDENWNKLDIYQGTRQPTAVMDKPDCIDSMRQIAEKLSEGICHVRVDLYLIGERIYFGEMTFFDGSGLTPFVPPEWDEILGSWIELPEKKVL